MATEKKPFFEALTKTGPFEKMHFSKKDIFTIPNILTYFRILLVPAFIIVYLNSLKAGSLAGHIWAIAIIGLAALTDVIDGIIARKFNQITDLGKIVDPIADKAMEFAMLFCVVIRYPLVWIPLAIFAAKEIISLFFSLWLFRRGKHISGANWAGKLCTVVLYAAMLALLVLPSIPENWVRIIVIITSTFMVLAFVVYMSMYVRLYIELKNEQKELNG